MYHIIKQQKFKTMSKIIFTIEMLGELTLASINANKEQNTDEIIDAIAEQYHTEKEPALKKTLGVKYSELAKARNAEVGRKYFYETIQTAEKNGSTKAPEKAVKGAAKTEGSTEAGTQTDATSGTDAGSTEGGVVTEGGEAPAPKPAPNRIKITDEIVASVIKGIAAGKKPKEIAGGDIGQAEGEPKTPLGITADNVYDIFHCRGRFVAFKSQVDAAKDAASKLPKQETGKAAGKSNKATDAATQAATTPNPGTAETNVSPLDAPGENKAIEVAQDALAKSEPGLVISGTTETTEGGF